MNLKSMSIDKLSKLREQVEAALSTKVIEERRAVQDQLGRLERLATNGLRARAGRGGPRGAVAPKYRNPANPSETWAGRGLKPRWLAAALKSGKKLLRISASPHLEKRSGQRPKNRAGNRLVCSDHSADIALQGPEGRSLLKGTSLQLYQIILLN
jgi:DNA-binding protein H-NS